MYRSVLYVRYIFLMISKMFCDLSLLHCPLGAVQQEKFTVLCTVSCDLPWKLMYIKLPMDL
jgi:hypothetical protein